MNTKLTTSEAAALAADEDLGASNLFEMVADANMNSGRYTPGPYSVKPYEGWFYLYGGNVWIGTFPDKEDADRIAYCLRVVEESEETDRKMGKS